MIDVYPINIEAVRDGSVIFRLKVYDEYTAMITMDQTQLAPSELVELFDAISKGYSLLGLKNP